MTSRQGGPHRGDRRARQGEFLARSQHASPEHAPSITPPTPHHARVAHMRVVSPSSSRLYHFEPSRRSVLHRTLTTAASRCYAAKVRIASTMAWCPPRHAVIERERQARPHYAPLTTTCRARPCRDDPMHGHAITPRAPAARLWTRSPCMPLPPHIGSRPDARDVETRPTRMKKTRAYVVEAASTMSRVSRTRASSSPLTAARDLDLGG